MLDIYWLDLSSFFAYMKQSLEKNPDLAQECNSKIVS